MAPLGSHNNNEKMTIAFLGYVFQVALNFKDPGILRILLHKGTPKDKTIALVVSNLFSELKRHGVTMDFIKLFHKSFMGKKPNVIRKLFIPKAYKAIFNDARKIADIKARKPEMIIETFTQAVYGISEKLDAIITKRLTKKIDKLEAFYQNTSFNFESLIENLELPSNLRKLTNSSKKGEQQKGFSLMEFLDGLSFPFLTSGLILAANFMSARVLFNNRPLLRTFSENIGRLKHPKRMLWLTDTFEDNNGVSMVLKAFHRHIVEKNLPIDILVCSSTLESDKNLIVVKPLFERPLPMYKQQVLRIPRIMDIQKAFMHGEYDRLICSTEGPMGLAGLFLKHAYSVQASFYMHTDWMVFSRKVLRLDTDNLSRLRRMIRAFYQSFDQVFVLNSEHFQWLTGHDMAFDPRKVKLTAHWADDCFRPKKSRKQELFGVSETTPVLLYAGRLSKEKGVWELPELYKQVAEKVNDVKFVFIGTGPDEAELQKAFPQAGFCGWIKHTDLPDYYSSADILVFPSKFDTFSCTVLEALQCSLPVVAYNKKGPGDIIQNGVNGFLAGNPKKMAEKIVEYLHDKNMQESFRLAALERSRQYDKEKITGKFLEDCGF
jgi:glycosyltransferase involved in cell wall biosynthesis